MDRRSTEEAKQLTIEYAKRILEVQLEKKQLDESIKEIKEEAKGEGVAISTLLRTLGKIKNEKKRTDADRIEEDTITEWLSSDKDIDNALTTLMSK
jgi:uncharacterized protein (UPF0335 family)